MDVEQGQWDTPKRGAGVVVVNNRYGHVTEILGPHKKLLCTGLFLLYSVYFSPV